MVEQNVQTSSIGIQIGDEIPGTAQNFFSFDLVISKHAAQKLKEELEMKVANDIDIEYAVVIVLSVQPQDAQKVQEAIKNAFEQKVDGSDNLIDSHMFEMRENGSINYKITYKNGKVYLSLTPSEEMINTLKETVTGFLGEQNEIFSNQTNKIEINFKQNRPFLEIIEKVFSGEEGLGSALLQQGSSEFKLTLNDELFDQVEQILNNIDPEMISQPPFLALKFAQNFEINLKFSSTKELPPLFQKYFATPKHLRNLANYNPPEEQKSDAPESKFLLGKLLSVIDEEFSVFITIPEIAAITIEASAPQIGKLAKKVHKSVELENPANLQNNDVITSVLKFLS